MTLEQRVESLEKTINDLKKQLVDIKAFTSCDINALRAEVQNTILNSISVTTNTNRS